MLFKDIKIGERFFDIVSGEYWQKIDALYAIMLSGGDCGLDSRAEEFKPFEEVELEV